MSYLVKDVSHCEPHRILAKLIEPLVWEEVLKIMDGLKLAEDLVTEAREIHSSKSFEPKLDELKRRIKTLENQQGTLVGRVASLPADIPADPFYQQLKKIELLRSGAQRELAETQSKPGSLEMPVELQSYRDFMAVVRNWGSTIRIVPDPEHAEERELCRKIIQHVVHKIEVTPNSFRIFFYCGEKNVRFATTQFLDKSLNEKTKPEDTLKASSGSNLLTNG
jgi:hypothetical protein